MRRLALVLCSLLTLVGCERPKPRIPLVVVRPGATQPTTAPTTQPLATTRPVVPVVPTASTLVIGGNPVVFPPTRVVLSGPILEISSRDPVAALKASYLGNRYYFQFRLDSPLTPQNSIGSVRVNPRSNSRRDEPDGIFLEGNNKQLQASDVQFRFLRQGDELMVDLSGSFLVFERGQMGPTQQVWVTGNLRAPIKMP